MLRAPVIHKPGTVFQYNNAGPYLLGILIQRKTGQSLVDYLMPRLFTPLGIERPVSLRLVPTAQVGDYVLVHAGFGIQIVDEQEAQETLDLVNAMTELVEEDQLATNPAEAY